MSAFDVPPRSCLGPCFASLWKAGWSGPAVLWTPEQGGENQTLILNNFDIICPHQVSMMDDHDSWMEMEWNGWHVMTWRNLKLMLNIHIQSHSHNSYELPNPNMMAGSFVPGRGHRFFLLGSKGIQNLRCIMLLPSLTISDLSLNNIINVQWIEISRKHQKSKDRRQQPNASRTYSRPLAPSLQYLNYFQMWCFLAHVMRCDALRWVVIRCDSFTLFCFLLHNSHPTQVQMIPNAL